MALHLDRGSVDLVAEDRDLREVLLELSAMMDVPFDLPPEVQGTVTLRVRNATYQQVLDLLLGQTFTCTIGPHDVVYIHKAGTTWRPGWEEAA